jgi:hypothetical protein
MMGKRWGKRKSLSYERLLDEIRRFFRQKGLFNQ